VPPFTTLVDAATLRAHLGDASWIVLDCRHALADFSHGRRLYDEAHLPGAFFADTERDLSGEKTGYNGRHPLPDPERFAAFLRALGASDATQIVAYDGGGEMFAARLWFMCRWIGHDAAAVLDGGYAAWKAAGYRVTAEPPVPRAPGTLAVRLRPSLTVDAAFLQAHLGEHSTQIVDARSADRFAGENETIDPAGGHIPGARNRPYAANFASSGCWKAPEDLCVEFAALGAPEQVVHQCGSGISAAVNLLAMEIAGLSGSRLYPGSWSEWVSDPSRPVERGDGARSRT
jgi:thiosulfate/3-mercaptopyruvate sulfurtransferase